MKKTLKAVVLHTLRNIPETRNSDTILTFHIIQKLHPLEVIYDQGKWWISVRGMNAIREDHVKRIRAKIQNEEGLYLPTTEEVRKQRKISEERWLDWSRGDNRIIDGGNPAFV